MIVLLAFAAMALPAPDCNQTSSARSRDGVELVVAKAVKPLTTPDTRAYVDQARLKHFSLSNADRLRIRKNTGICRCPGVMGSCGLGPGGQMILANAHLLFDEDGKGRKPFAQCTFQNQALPPDPPVPFVVEKDPATGKFTFSVATLRPYAIKEAVNDHAVVKLAHRVSGANPFPLATGGAKLRPGQWIMSVSGLQVNLPAGMKADLTSPIVQECMVTQVDDRNPMYSGTFGSTCRATPYASGSFNFTRDELGELQVVGIMQAGCDNSLVGKPCAADGTMVNNIMVRSHFLNDIMDLAQSQ